MDQLYFEEGYLEAGYFTVIREAGANLSGTFTPSFTVAIADTTGYYIPDYIEEGYYALPIQEGAASISAAFSTSAVGTRIQQAAAALAVAATVTASAGRIQQASATFNGVFATTLTANALKNHTVILDSQFAIAADAVKTTATDITLANAVNLSLQAAKTTSTSLNASAAFAITAQATKAIEESAALAAAFNQSQVAGFLLTSTANISSRAGMLAIPRLTTERPYNGVNSGLGFRSDSKVFGTHSARANSNGQYATFTPQSRDFLPHSETGSNGEMAIDLWAQGSATDAIFLIDDPSGGPAADVYLTIAANGTPLLYVNGTTTIRISGTAFSGFNHFRILFEQTDTFTVNVAMYQNGSRKGTATISNWVPSALSVLRLGDYFNNAGGGGIDEFRILKSPTLFSDNGWSISQTTITVPSAAFINTEDTKILLHLDNNLLDDTDTLYSVGANLSTSAALTGSISGTQNASAALASAASLDADAITLIEASASLTGTGGFSVSIDAIVPGDVYLESQFNLVVETKKTTSFASTLESNVQLTAEAVNLPGFRATLDAASTLTVNAEVLPGFTANLNVSSSLDSEAYFEYLRLNDGASIITTNINQDLGASVLNMWLRLDRNLAAGEQIYLWRTARTLEDFDTLPSYPGTTDRISFMAIGKWSSDSGGSANKYYFLNRRYSSSGPSNFVFTDYRVTINAEIDFTDWHNVTLPFMGGESGVVGGTPSIDGGAYPTVQVGSTSNLNAGTVYSNINAGVWDANTSDLSVEIHKLWIKDRDAAVFTAPNFYAIPWGQKYGVNGAVDGVVPDIYHNWEDGLIETGNNVDPQWNYRVATGVVITGFTFDVPSALTANFALNTNIDVIVKANAIISSAASLSAESSRTRNPDAINLAAAASITADVEKLVRTSSSLSTQFAQTTTAVKTTDVDLSLNTNANLAVELNRVRLTDAQLSTSVSLAAEPKITRTFDAALGCAFTQPDTDYIRYRDANIDTDAIASSLTVAAKVGDFFVNADLQSTLTVTARKTTDTPITLPVVVDTNFVVIKAVEAEGSIAAEFTALTEGFKIRAAVITTSVSATVSVDADVIRGGVANLSVAANTSITYTRVRFNTVGLNTSVTINTAGDKLRPGVVDIEARASVLATPFRVQRGEANLQVSGFVLTAGNVIHLDPFRTLLVPQETRYIKVLEERRALIVKEETRVLTV